MTLMGGVTYISTKRSVNIDLCEKVMNMLMDETEAILKESRSIVYAVDEKESKDNNDRLLDVMYLAVMNHIIASQEYETMIEDYLHFFLGRNETAVCYIDGAGENDCNNTGYSPGIMIQFEADSKLVFMLSEVMLSSTGQ